MLPPGTARSSTGARSTLKPSAVRYLPVRWPWRAAASPPAAPISAADIVGGPGRRFTSPPSWSTEISSGWRSPRGRRISLQAVDEGARLGIGVEVLREQDHARDLPSRIMRTSAGGGLWSRKAGDDALAGELADRRARGPPRRAPPRQCAEPASATSAAIVAIMPGLGAEAERATPDERCGRARQARRATPEPHGFCQPLDSITPSPRSRCPARRRRSARS